MMFEFRMRKLREEIMKDEEEETIGEKIVRKTTSLMIGGENHGDEDKE